MSTKTSSRRARPLFTWALLLCGSLMLAACDHGNSAPPQVTLTKADPATPATLKLYNSTCHACHGNPSSGAPQQGDAKAWAPRLAQGKDTVLAHVVNGYKGMPPMGMCMQCTEDDFTALVEYMSGSKLQ
ncbi:MAG TPA: cytochrome c5 family protein [Stenotrophobium sp.]|nr:cytochrome c5 family protein [Stenotrophobium sp.]